MGEVYNSNLAWELQQEAGEREEAERGYGRRGTPAATSGHFELHQSHHLNHLLVSKCASEVALEPVSWIWKGRIARGKHTCIAGEPGTGKSQLSMSIAATITMGGAWPCGEGKSPQGSVIILSAEDGAADTIVPRLHAAEADCGSVHIIQSVMDGDERRTFNLQRDLALLEAECERIGDVLLIIIDPVSFVSRQDR